MCVVQVGTLVLKRSHKYFELEIFQFYLWSWMMCTSRLADMECIARIQHAIKVYTIRYDTRCYFNVRSKADMSRLNLPHLYLKT